MFSLVLFCLISCSVLHDRFSFVRPPVFSALNGNAHNSDIAFFYFIAIEGLLLFTTFDVNGSLAVFFFLKERRNIFKIAFLVICPYV